MFERVVFPAPFSPSSAWTSPFRSSRSTPSRAGAPSKLLLIPRARTTTPSEGASAGSRAGSPSVGIAAGTSLRDPAHALDRPVDLVGLLRGEGLAGLQLLGAVGRLQRPGVGVEPAVYLRLGLGDLVLDVLRHVVAPLAQRQREQPHGRPR